MWGMGHAALLLRLGLGIKFDSNDLGSQNYRKVTSLRIPSIVAKVLLRASLDQNTWLEASEIVADAYLDIYSSPQDHRLSTRAQLMFIQEQDKLTGRAQRIFDQLKQRNSNSQSGKLECQRPY